jgi:hypothetical protein
VIHRLPQTLDPTANGDRPKSTSGTDDPECPLLCRFSDAGDDEAGDRLEDRRLKSAEAGNRGKWGTVGAAGSMGI